MFESLSLLALQQYWWIIVSLLGSILVFLLFVQGGQTLIYTLGHTETERTLIINSLGRKWEFTFTTLVTFGGAFFASFPLFYATSFGGAYWLWMAILFSFVVQAVAYEYRSKPNNFLGQKTYEWFLFLNGAFGSILLGVAVGSLFTGNAFSVSDLKATRWENAWHGIDSLWSLKPLCLGITVYFLARVLGLLYFMNNINHSDIKQRAQRLLWRNAIPFVFAFLTFVVLLLLSKGYSYASHTGIVTIEDYKYLHNLLNMPIVLAMLLIGVFAVLYGIIISLFRTTTKGIWFTGPGAVLVVFSLFMLAGFNNTCFYPSSFNMQQSLTIQNASSSHYTLTAMSYVSLLVPFVVAYIFYAWRSINKNQLDENEIKSESHVY